MKEPTSIPIPIALRELIISNNKLLQNYQQELSNNVILANNEIMQLLGLNSKEWQLDIKTMKYVKSEPVKENDSSVS
jgi:hypothetical protein